MKRLVLSLALIGAATSADGITWYGYAFEQSRSSLHLRDYEGDGALDGRYTAIPYEGEGYEDTLQFSFTAPDSFNIAGMTIDLANPGLDNFFAEGFLDPWPSPGGWVTFDASGMVSDWHLYDDMGEFGIGLAYEHSSAAIPIDLGSYQWPDTANAADYAGAVHYGVQYSEPDDIWFKMTPGRWRNHMAGDGAAARAGSGELALAAGRDRRSRLAWKTPAPGWLNRPSTFCQQLSA